MWPANPLGDCPFETGWPYVIHEIRWREYRLPEQYAKAVSNADVRAVNDYEILYSVVKRERDDGSGIVDLVLE